MIKVVYAMISNRDDCYFEQMWASAWSLKERNPKVYVVVLTDEATLNKVPLSVKRRCEECVDEFCPITFDEEYTNKEKSRWIKTNLRGLVSGDFLFIDTDTIITGSIESLFDFPCSDIGMVLDNNCHSSEIKSFPIFQNMYVKPLRRIYDEPFRERTTVYNSGVILVRDTSKSHAFFKAWHHNWLRSKSMGECRDQLSLVKTLQEHSDVVTEIPGIYNCQIRSSIQFLFDAVIIHTFCSQVKSELSPILDNEFYWEIREQGYITDRVKIVIKNSKSSFGSPSILVDKKMMLIRFEPAYILFYRCLLSSRVIERFLYQMISFISRAFLLALRY